MTACEVMRMEAELAYGQLRNAVSQISEPQAWAKIELLPDAYLHTNGTIIGIVQHIAGGKFIYGSAAFRSLEVRFRDIHARIEEIDTSWDGAVAYLDEAHKYWTASWADLTDDDLNSDRMFLRGDMRPAWRLIATVTQHDMYHLGQIEVFADSLQPTNIPPDMRHAGERKELVDLPTW